MLTKEQVNEKYKNDSELLEYVNDLENKANNDYVKDNILLKGEIEKLKQNNLLLYNLAMNGKQTKEDAETDKPKFADYSEEINKALRNKK